ncbi:putative Zn(II)2Cys6 transcription factor [Aspergillus pseudocaelatus]|uniref:Zn(II)2Cys6 transcription factor n=1 Tax=Aspergillus pseudocaelatus TaxID=1825620 RepID=A0ABQ6X0G2_9EURO|nr:putative Zn(II)2Cys6 transcription factor [Aspergillus pseudocaelatus]
MPPRRFHKKSRTGCAACRARRIKCDETHPECANCQRAGIICHYATPRIFCASSALPDHREQTLSSVSSPQSQDKQGRNDARFDTLDLRLMHHYTLMTSTSLFDGRQQDLWQAEIPTEAYSCPLLMHGVLAIAALHLVSSGSAESSSLVDRALHHHTISLQIFNREISDISSTNAHVLFAYSVLLIVWAYASFSTKKDRPLQLDSLLGSLELVRGCKTVFEIHSNSIKKHPIGQFIGSDESPIRHDLSDAARQALACLRTKVEDFIDSMAIDYLERLLQGVRASSDTRLVIGWPALLDNSFWTRIKRHQPVALLILAHYAILLAQFNGHSWWLSGWSDHLLEAVDHILEDSDKTRLDWEIHLTWIKSEMICTS